jgi:GH15 family glucan-1,4-alpha-glucosidase
MARSIILSNNNLFIALDNKGMVRDVYFPHVGQEDHVRGHYLHRVGVWVDGRMSWFNEDNAWSISISCEDESLASAIVARHPQLQVELVFKDIVYNEKTIFVRRVTVTNRSDRAREIKLYFGHQFEIYKAHGGDTAYFDPMNHAVIHYKGRRVFLISAVLDGERFEDYAIGLSDFNGQEGTHRDADDGILSKNPIEHGPVDSVIGLYANYTPGQSKVCHYWVAAATSIAEAVALNQYVQKKTPEHLVRTASDYWKAWVNAYEWSFYGLSKEHIALFKRSLMYVRAHVDEGGGVLASGDSDMLQYGMDTYAYVWPRDAAYTALALDHAGDTNVAKRFFLFCKEVITEDGYLMHKYLPDKSLGSSWHPWIKDGKFQLPIQEDETALVIYALHEHFLRSHDLEFLEDMFNPLVEKAADFMVRYRDAETHLPQPSYDLWEEKHASSTFTASTVYGALIAAAELSKVLGKAEHEARYMQAAIEIRDGIMKYLWDDNAGVFLKMVTHNFGEDVYDRTVDISSVYGVFSFGVLPPNDPRLARGFENTVRILSRGISIGGIARYEGDYYYRSDSQSAGNPWITTTLWYAEYLIAIAKTDADFERVREIFTWVVRYSSPAGILAEQLHPQTGAQIGASPLTWSHAAYVNAVLKYFDRLQELGICPTCKVTP